MEDLKKTVLKRWKIIYNDAFPHPRLAEIGKRSRLSGAIKKAQDYATVTIRKLAVVFYAITDQLNYKKLSGRKKMPGSY